VDEQQIQQDFTGQTSEVLIKDDQLLIKTSKTATGMTSSGTVFNMTDPDRRGRGRPKKEPEPTLTPYEQNFIDAYLNPACGYDSRSAAIKAGYPEKGSKDTGLKLMNDVRILRMIELGRKKMSVAIATSRNDMLRKVEAFLAVAMEKKDCTGAARLLSLEIGMLGFNEPVKMDLTGSINISFGSGEPIIVASKNLGRYDDAEETEITEEVDDKS